MRLAVRDLEEICDVRVVSGLHDRQGGCRAVSDGNLNLMAGGLREPQTLLQGPRATAFKTVDRRFDCYLVGCSRKHRIEPVAAWTCGFCGLNRGLDIWSESGVAEDRAMVQPARHCGVEEARRLLVRRSPA